MSRVAVVELLAPQGAFFADQRVADVADRLYAAGHEAQRVRVGAADGERLAAWLRGFDPDWVVLSRLWEGGLVHQLRPALPPAVRWVRLGQGAATPLDGLVDAVLDPDGVVAALTTGSREDSGASWQPSSARQIRARLSAYTLPAACAPLVVLTDGGQDSAALPRVSVEGPGGGCPFLLDVRDNPHFAALDLDPRGVQTKGCSFCLDNHGAYALPKEADVVASFIAQLRARRQGIEGRCEVLLTGERPHPFLPAYFRALADHPELGPVELMIKSRVDWLLQYADGPIREALALAQAGGHLLNCYLVGFESFDPFHLALFNKGVDVEANVRAIAVLRQLAREFPTAFTFDKYRAHGIVLFTPWTRPGHLRTNAIALRAVGFDGLRDDMLSTRLRLYPHVPLHAKARAEGLLTDAFDRARGDRAAEQGYDASVPWRFADPATETIYQACAALVPLRHVLGEANLLELVVALVTREPQLTGHPQAVAAWLRQRVQAWGADAARALCQLGGAELLADDPELQRLQSAAAKAACFKEGVPRGEVAALCEAFAAMGLSAAVVHHHGLPQHGGDHTAGEAFAVIAVARDRPTLAEAIALQQRLTGGDHTVVPALGALMGYPACCVGAFAAQSGHRDNLALELQPLRTSRGRRLRAELNRLSGVPLLSHHLCAVDCADSIGLAAETLQRWRLLHPLATEWVEARLRTPLLLVEGQAPLAVEAGWVADRVQVAAILSRSDRGRWLARGDSVLASPLGVAVVARAGAQAVEIAKWGVFLAGDGEIHWLGQPPPPARDARPQPARPATAMAESAQPSVVDTSPLPVPRLRNMDLPCALGDGWVLQAAQRKPHSQRLEVQLQHPQLGVVAAYVEAHAAGAQQFCGDGRWAASVYGRPSVAVADLRLALGAVLALVEAVADADTR